MLLCIIRVTGIHTFFMLADLNYIIIVFVTGAVLLAAVYHTVLYIHRRTWLLAHYSMYLWVTFLYTLLRFFNPNDSGSDYPLAFLNPDETLQMLAFAMYIRFMGTALELDSVKEKQAFFFVKVTPYVIGAYIVLQIIFSNSDVADLYYFIPKICIRGYLLLLGLFMLLKVILRRKKIYYNYLAAGAISMIFFGAVSSVTNVVNPDHRDFFLLGPLSWLMIGFFTDVIFFSSAIGYKIKTDAIEKENALNMLIQQNEMLKQKEIEKIQAIYKTREQERLRIANDLHDDIGASLSSLQIYGTIAEQAIETNPGKAVEMIHKISVQSKVLLENMSDIVWSMKSARDNTTTLEAKIKNFGVELLSDKNIDFGYHISTDAEAALRGIAVRKNILLLIKEAMNNMAKYSAAKTASLKMGIKNNNLALEITDNGIGFDIEKTAAGNGLKSMEYRIKELKGSLVISSIPGQGTCITALVPLRAINEIN